MSSSVAAVEGPLPLEQFLEVAWHNRGFTLLGKPVTELIIRCGTREVHIRYDVPAPPPPAAAPCRSPMSRAILSALQAGPLSPKDCAAACDYEYSGTFRTCVKTLEDEKELVRLSDGKLDLP